MELRNRLKRVLSYSTIGLTRLAWNPVKIAKNMTRPAMRNDPRSGNAMNVRLGPAALVKRAERNASVQMEPIATSMTLFVFHSGFLPVNWGRSSIRAAVPFCRTRNCR